MRKTQGLGSKCKISETHWLHVNERMELATSTIKRGSKDCLEPMDVPGRINTMEWKGKQKSHASLMFCILLIYKPQKSFFFSWHNQIQLVLAEETKIQFNFFIIQYRDWGQRLPQKVGNVVWTHHHPKSKSVRAKAYQCILLWTGKPSAGTAGTRL